MTTHHLILIDGADEQPREWRLDPAVRERGRRGVAAAREILAAARPAFDDDVVAA